MKRIQEGEYDFPAKVRMPSVINYFNMLIF